MKTISKMLIAVSSGVILAQIANIFLGEYGLASLLSGALTGWIYCLISMLEEDRKRDRKRKS